MWKPFRAAISFLADLGGAVIAIGAGLGLVVAAVVIALKPFDEALAVGLLATGACLGVWGLAAYLIPPKARPPAPAQPQPSPQVPSANPYDKARKLQADHEAAAVVKANAEREEKERKLVLNKRSESRAIREELLDNAKALDLVSAGTGNAVLRLRSDRFNDGLTLLREHDAPSPYVEVSAAYRETNHLWQTLTGYEETMGEPYFIGNDPSLEELNRAQQALERAVSALDKFDLEIR